MHGVWLGLQLLVNCGILARALADPDDSDDGSIQYCKMAQTFGASCSNPTFRLACKHVCEEGIQEGDISSLCSMAVKFGSGCTNQEFRRTCPEYCRTYQRSEDVEQMEAAGNSAVCSMAVKFGTQCTNEEFRKICPHLCQSRKKSAGKFWDKEFLQMFKGSYVHIKQLTIHIGS